jgi:hypothetical protein
MQSSAWASLLRHIPAEQHDQYMLVTVSGTEIAIQGLLRIEEECVALKGRLAGSQEAGRVFFVPYAQIDYFGTQKPVKDSEFNDLFGSLSFTDEPVPPPASEPPPPVAPSQSVIRSHLPRPVIRSEVLERYRSRPGSASMLPNPKPNGS